MKALADRFHAKVGPKLPNGCMEWQAHRLPNGYGMIRRGSLKAGKVLAHRLAYELVHGAIPQGMIVMHTCDNPSCVNHEHLRLGFHKDNTADMVAKGRHGWRDGMPWQKLSVADIDAIRRLRAEGRTQQAIADHFGVSRPLISMHLNGKLLISSRSSEHRQ